MTHSEPPTGPTPPPPGRRRQGGDARFGVIRPGGTGGPGQAPPAPSYPPGAQGAPGGPAAGSGPIVPHISSGSDTSGAPPPPGSFGAGVAGPAGAATGYDPSRPFAAPAAGGGGINANAIVSGLFAGAVGGVLGFVLSRLYDPAVSYDTTPSDLRVQTGIWTLLIGIGLAVVLAAWTSASTGAWEQAGRRAAAGALVGAVAGFIAGYAAQAIYSSMLDSVDYLDSTETIENKMLLARVVGWALFGTILGAGTGLPLGPRKVVNGLAGGAIGGAVGGFVFEKVSQSATSNTGPQFVGILCTGLAVGLFVGIVDRITRQWWLQGVAGPLRGREIILFKPRTTVGSAPSCDLVLANDPTVAPHHLTLVMTGTGLHVEAAAPVRVDGADAPAMAALRAGQTLETGRSSFTIGRRAASGPSPVAGGPGTFPPPGGPPGPAGPAGPPGTGGPW